jgi:hypothetical protein
MPEQVAEAPLVPARLSRSIGFDPLLNRPEQLTPESGGPGTRHNRGLPASRRVPLDAGPGTIGWSSR